jgi:hypothetical protein
MPCRLAVALPIATARVRSCPPARQTSRARVRPAAETARAPAIVGAGATLYGRAGIGRRLRRRGKGP